MLYVLVNARVNNRYEEVLWMQKNAVLILQHKK